MYARNYPHSRAIMACIEAIATLVHYMYFLPDDSHFALDLASLDQSAQTTRQMNSFVIR